IKVIHLGTTLGESLAASETVATPLEAPYLLYVGKRGLYKNFDGFFRAIQPVLHRHPDLHLICAGGGAFNQAEQALFYASGLANRVHYRPANDTSLIALYRHARAFVFPSLNEGFGIPVLEAYSSGCPVVLSNRSSLPEVGGDAALYFDPEDDDSIADAVERVLTDNALHAALSQKGTERLRNFSCDKTAQQTLEVYKSLS
ncbi:MAG: glycosyltransferase family 1 protein, partial [Cytophagaceae bacterium]